MNNVNMTDIAHKIHFIYKDECERNVAAMVIFYNNGKYFFDETYRNKMTNDEVEALLLRGALVHRDGKYFKPSSFDNGGVSFSESGSIIGEDVNVRINNIENTINDCIQLVASANLLDTTTIIRGNKFTNDGGTTSNASYCLFEQYIPIDRSKTIIYIVSKYLDSGLIELTNKVGNDVCLYNGNKEYITRVTSTNTIAIADYPDAAYLRFNMAISVFDNRKIGVFYDEIPIKWSEYGQYYMLTDNVRNEQLDKYTIDCWGDSLTNGVGGNGNSYVSYLRELLGDKYTLNKYGNGGETSQAIASRHGGYDIYLKPFTLPVSGKVAVELYSYSNMNVKLQNVYGINPCYIDGVQCSFSISNNIYYIEQVNGSGEHTFNRPVKLNTNGSLTTKNNINIIWCGSNDIVGNNYTIDDILNSIQVMIDNLEHDKYIIIGLTSKSYHEDIIIKNNVLGKKFGKRFLDLRTYILDYGLDDMNIKATESDTTNISNGEIPTSLLSDDIHFNAVGYELIANVIYKKGKDLEYWK